MDGCWTTFLHFSKLMQGSTCDSVHDIQPGKRLVSFRTSIKRKMKTDSSLWFHRLSCEHSDHPLRVALIIPMHFRGTLHCLEPPNVFGSADDVTHFQRRAADQADQTTFHLLAGGFPAVLSGSMGWSRQNQRKTNKCKGPRSSTWWGRIGTIVKSTRNDRKTKAGTTMNNNKRFKWMNRTKSWNYQQISEWPNLEKHEPAAHQRPTKNPPRSPRTTHQQRTKSPPTSYQWKMKEMARKSASRGGEKRERQRQKEKKEKTKNQKTQTRRVNPDETCIDRFLSMDSEFVTTSSVAWVPWRSQTENWKTESQNESEKHRRGREIKPDTCQSNRCCSKWCALSECLWCPFYLIVPIHFHCTSYNFHCTSPTFWLYSLSLHFYCTHTCSLYLSYIPS